MTVKDSIIAILEDKRGEYVSGEEIAARLSVSRSAVWKAVKSLQSDGCRINAVTNKGYMIASDSPVISAPGIKRYLSGQAEGLRLDVRRTVGSTNAVVKELAADGEPEGLVVVAAEQTQGRGRFTRKFYSPPGTGVYFSLLLRPKLPASDSILLTTAAAVAVAGAVEEVSGRHTVIKWVNDVFIGEKKICGVLTEAALSVENSSLDYAVLGIGVNVTRPEGGFPPEISDVADAVFDRVNAVPDACNRIVAEVLNRFMICYADIADRTFIGEYKRRSCVIGRRVTVRGAGEERRALAVGIDDRCRLIVRFPDGSEEALSSGEISVKLTD